MKLAWGLYCITDQASALGRSDDDIARGLILGGADVLQYRAKKVSAREQLTTAIKLRALTQVKNVPFIVNDRIDLAVACGADGVHLGQDDLPVSAARLMVGQDLIVGISTHTLQQALRAEADGADYIGFGPIFSTQTKENNVPPVGVEALAQVMAQVRIPVVVIGGIKQDHLRSLASAGAHCIAVVTALTSAPDVAETTRTMKAHWTALRHGALEAKARVDREIKVQSAKKVSFL
jgi:thiamine-phosphate pyrophosphorylase